MTQLQINKLNAAALSTFDEIFINRKTNDPSILLKYLTEETALLPQAVEQLKAVFANTNNYKVVSNHVADCLLHHTMVIDIHFYHYRVNSLYIELVHLNDKILIQDILTVISSAPEKLVIDSAFGRNRRMEIASK